MRIKMIFRGFFTFAFMSLRLIPVQVPVFSEFSAGSIVKSVLMYIAVLCTIIQNHSDPETMDTIMLLRIPLE